MRACALIPSCHWVSKGLSFLVLISLTAAAAPPKCVLVVHSLGEHFAPFNVMSATFRTELAQRSAEPLEFYAVSLQAARVGVTPAEYKTFVDGTKILKLDEAKKAFKKGSGFSSIYGSSKISDDFKIDNKVYKEHQDVNSYIDPSLTEKM